MLASSSMAMREPTFGDLAYGLLGDRGRYVSDALIVFLQLGTVTAVCRSLRYLVSSFDMRC